MPYASAYGASALARGFDRLGEYFARRRTGRETREAAEAARRAEDLERPGAMTLGEAARRGMVANPNALANADLDAQVQLRAPEAETLRLPNGETIELPPAAAARILESGVVQSPSAARRQGLEEYIVSERVRQAMAPREPVTPGPYSPEALQFYKDKRDYDIANPLPERGGADDRFRINDLDRATMLAREQLGVHYDQNQGGYVYPPGVTVLDVDTAARELMAGRRPAALTRTRQEPEFSTLWLEALGARPAPVRREPGWVVRTGASAARPGAAPRPKRVITADQKAYLQATDQWDPDLYEVR